MTTFCFIVFLAVFLSIKTQGCFARLTVAAMGTIGIAISLYFVLKLGVSIGLLDEPPPAPPRQPTPYDRAIVNREVYDEITKFHTKERIDKLVGAPGQLIDGKLTGYGRWAWHNDIIPDEGWFCKRSVGDSPQSYPEILQVSFIDNAPQTKTLGRQWEKVSRR